VTNAGCFYKQLILAVHMLICCKNQGSLLCFAGRMHCRPWHVAAGVGTKCYSVISHQLLMSQTAD
jgi:hypothetical protein